MPVDIKQCYRDCNAASHFLKEALTTKPRKGPLRGKILVSGIIFTLVLDEICIVALKWCIVVALHVDD